MGIVRFFSFGSRTGPARWLAWLLLAGGAATACVVVLPKVGGAAPVAVFGALGLVAAKLLTESVRRLHDCGQDWVVGLAPTAGIAALVVTVGLRWIGHGADPIVWTTSALAALATAALMLRRGSRASNVFGPPPALFATGTATTQDRAGVASAALLVLVGLALGTGVVRWEVETGEQREARLRLAAEPSSRSPPGKSPRLRTSAEDRANADLSNRIDGLLNGSDAR